MPEGKTAATLLAAFSICAGNAFVNLFNQVARRADLGDFGSQPRVKVGFLTNFTQYFARKIVSSQIAPAKPTVQSPRCPQNTLSARTLVKIIDHRQ